MTDRPRRLAGLVAAGAAVVLLVVVAVVVAAQLRSDPSPAGAGGEDPGGDPGRAGGRDPGGDPDRASGPLPGWELTPSNTGLAPFGLRCDDLPEYTGSERPPAGTVIEKQRITEPMILAAGDITITKSCIQPTTTWQGLPILSTTDNNTGDIARRTVTIEDSEFDGSKLGDQEAAQTGAFVGIADLYRNYVHGLGSGLALMNTGQTLNSVVEGNLVTGLVAYGDPATTGNHSDAFTVRDFDTSRRPDRSLMVSGNRFDCSSGNDTGAFFVQTYAGDIGNLTVTGNLLEGGGYQLGLTSGFGNDYADVVAMDNRFTGTGYGAAYVQGGAGWDAWSDNYLNDPAAPGNRGAVVPEP